MNRLKLIQLPTITYPAAAAYIFIYIIKTKQRTFPFIYFWQQQRTGGRWPFRAKRGERRGTLATRWTKQGPTLKTPPHYLARRELLLPSDRIYSQTIIHPHTPPTSPKALFKYFLKTEQEKYIVSSFLLPNIFFKFLQLPIMSSPLYTDRHITVRSLHIERAINVAIRLALLSRCLRGTSTREKLKEGAPTF